jgi:hypothetical protein
VERCDDCGFEYAAVVAATVSGRLRTFGPRYAEALNAAPFPRRRPAEGIWSPIEYACHLRDVFDVQRQRLALALREDEPVFVPMDRDRRAVAEAYNEQHPRTVLADLAAAATALAEAFNPLSTAELTRTGVYPWPQPQARSLLWLGQHSVHEGEHHLLDIVRGSDPTPPGAA